MHLGTIARLARSFAPGWVARAPGPARAVVALTRRCNLRCRICRTYTLPPGREMTAPEVELLCRGMPALAWLDLTGGEPMLRADVEEVFAAVLRASPALAVLHFPTNGWLTERAVACARLAARERPDVALLVTVSLDGPPELHDRLRGRPGSFERAARTFDALRRIDGVQTFVGTTVGPHNRDHLAALREHLEARLEGFEDRWWHWNRLQLSRHFFANEELETAAPGDDRALIREHARRRFPPRSPVDLMELGFLVNLEAYVRGEPVGVACQSLHRACFVSADGLLYPCHVYDRPVLDLRQHGFRVAQLWDRPEVRAARRDVLALACGGCFTPCEAYPMLAGSPMRAAWLTLRRAATWSAR